MLALRVSGASRLSQAASQVLRPRHLKSDSRKVESAEVTSCPLPSDPQGSRLPLRGPFFIPGITRRSTMKPKDKLKQIAQKPAFWIVVGSLLTAAGLNIPPQILDALQILGPLLAF